MDFYSEKRTIFVLVGKTMSITIGTSTDYDGRQRQL
jgi:hypothetical protein